MSYNRKTKGTDISYHAFPKDSTLQKAWLHKCMRKDTVNVLNARVCSKHFTESDYIRDLKSELLHSPRLKKLKPDAVPSLCIPSKNTDNINVHDTLSLAKFETTSELISSNKANRCYAREVRKRALETFVTISPKKSMTTLNTIDEATQCSLSNEDILTKRIKELEQENLRLNSLCTRFRARNKCLSQEIVCLRRKNQKNIHSEVENKVKEILEKLFTARQIRYLIKGGRTNWTKEDICKGITLRAVAKTKGYIFLRNKLGFPLPGISTLKRWISRSFHCFPGILHDVLMLMKTQSDRLSYLERLTVLSFDEMNVDSRISYDQEQDMIVGPHSNVLVIMVRGLFAKWKQPVFFNFDTKMTASLLKEIIVFWGEIGYDVVAAVSDLGSKNRAVWNELQVTHENTCFQNPHNSKRVWVFADVPHLLKLLRNHFIDDGFKLPGNKNLNKEPIEKLLTSDSKEMKICPKLTSFHLNVKGRDRQRVFLAAQLFSNRTSKAIHYLFPEEEHLSKFIQLINDSFDILNSRIPVCEDNPLSCGFGIHREIQEKVLRELHACCISLRVGKAKHLLPFQKGFLTSIRSLLGLFSDLQPLGIKYILTARLNQDCLENFFSQIRGLGKFYDNPLPTEVRHRIRLLLLGTNVSDVPLSNSAAVKSVEDDAEFLTSNLFIGVLPDMSEALEMIEGSAAMKDIFFQENEDNATSSTPISGPDCSVEGFRFLAGYIAYRAREYNYSLGTPTGQMLSIPSTTPTTDIGWIEKLSRGGLLVPSNEWMDQLKHFELMFNELHGQDLLREKNIVYHLCTLISQRYPEIPMKIVKLFVRTRTFIRLKHLNRKAKERKSKEAQIRKARQWHNSSK